MSACAESAADGDMYEGGRKHVYPGVSGLRTGTVMALLMVVLAGCASTADLPPGDAGAEPGALVEGSDGVDAAMVRQFRQVFERYRGTPYRYGGTGAGGFDCSGFIMTAYREALDQPVPRTTSQLLRAGQDVPTDQVRPGDLVFFRINGKEQHAGIYMGSRRFIHSASSTGVTESSLNNGYWRDRYSRARRIR